MAKMKKRVVTVGSKTSIRSATSLDALVGQRLRARRMELHMSQEELGNKLGVSFQQVQKYERGVNRIGAGRLSEICRAMETTMDYFMGDVIGGDRVPAPSKISTYLSTKDGLEVIEAMMSLNKAHTRAILSLARTLNSAYG